MNQKPALLILYNPYYQDDVIESHLEILKKDRLVAFGKVKSKMRENSSHMSHSHASQPESASPAARASSTIPTWQELIESTSAEDSLQLFLSDYANLYVCKVIAISRDKRAQAPAYYTQKQLEVELWFMLSDMRELVRNDFVSVRDNFLANFITLHNNRTFALYGNDYTYPLFIAMKEHRDYFASGAPHYIDMFKSAEQIRMHKLLGEYVFGDELIYMLLPDSIENLVNAEIEYQANKNNPLYDYTGIIMLYGKTMEQEIARFYQAMFRVLVDFEATLPEPVGETPLLQVSYSVQQVESSVQEWLAGVAKTKPALGTTKHLLKSAKGLLDLWRRDKTYKLESSLNKHDIYHFTTTRLPPFISTLQAIRNPAAHASKPDIKHAAALREQILGIGTESVLVSLLRAYQALQIQASAS